MTGDAAATALTLARGGQAALELHRQRIDDLNVYPVPDGDTGSNLLDTAIALTNGLAELGDDAGREEIARAATRSALMGARGNSGVILSQIVRGFAESLGAEPAAIDGRAVARAVRAASESAYHAVRQPVEGTMLTAVREMAEAAEAAPDLPLPALLDRMLEAGDRAVERTPELLAALRDAGVVDAGAAGLVEFARGAAAASRGERITAPASISAARPLGVEALHAEPSRYRYCTTFLVEGDGIDAAGLERDLDALGDSLLVVGEPPTVKVHVHTDDPPAALALGLAMGVVDRVEIANMHTQTAERERRLRVVATRPATAVVAIVAGEGNESAYRAAGRVPDRRRRPVDEPLGRGDRPGDRGGGRGGRRRPAEQRQRDPGRRARRGAGRPAGAGGADALGGDRPGADGGLQPVRAAGADGGRDGQAQRRASLRRADHGRSRRHASTASPSATASTSRWSTAASSPRPGDPSAAADAMLGRLAEDGAERIVLLRGDADAFDPGPWLARARLAHPQVQLELRDGGQPLYPLLGLGRGARAADRREHRDGAGLDLRRRLAAGGCPRTGGWCRCRCGWATAATWTTSRCRRRSSTAGCRWRPSCRRPPRRRPARSRRRSRSWPATAGSSCCPSRPRCRRRPAAPSSPPASSTRAASGSSCSRRRRCRRRRCCWPTGSSGCSSAGCPRIRW